MENAQKAQAIVRIISWRLEEKTREVARLRGELLSAQEYRKAMKEAEAKYNDDYCKWTNDSNEESEKYSRERIAREQKELDAITEIYQYAIEVFLNKIP